MALRCLLWATESSTHITDSLTGIRLHQLSHNFDQDPPRTDDLILICENIFIARLESLEPIVNCCFTDNACDKRSTNSTMTFGCSYLSLEVTQHHGSEVTWADTSFCDSFCYVFLGTKELRALVNTIHGQERSALSNQWENERQKAIEYWLAFCEPFLYWHRYRKGLKGLSPFQDYVPLTRHRFWRKILK